MFSVKRAIPNFHIAIKEKDHHESDVVKMGTKRNAYFSAHVNNTVSTTNLTTQSRTYGCYVTWHKTNTTQELIVDQKTTTFICK